MRITHWINALAMLVMIGSGWQIYDASPLFDFEFPRDIALGSWLAGALLWHFAAMWVLVINGLVYLTLGIATGRFGRKLFPIYPREVFRDVFAALRGKLVARRPFDVQRGAEAALSRRDPRRHRHRAVRACRSGSRCNSMS